MKKLLSVILVVVMVLAIAMTGCSTTENNETVDEAKTAILVVSFGTSFADNLELTITETENAIKAAFPGEDVRRAFTAQIVIDILEENGMDVDNVTEALDRAVADGVEKLVVVPTHLMNGLEYNDVKNELESYKEYFTSVSLGEPLLMSDADFDKVIAAITEDTASYDDGETAICFMGHGTHAESNKVYAQMQEKLAAAGFENYYVGTVEAAPTVEDVLALVDAKGSYKKVVLQPLMLVAGDHANNDMAGDEEDTWKTIFENAGYEVECVLKGLGQIPAIRDIYVEHAKAAVDALQ